MADGASSSCDTGAPHPRQPCHVFLSHAGEQKQIFVDFVMDAFKTRCPNLNVFLDEYCLEPCGAAMLNIRFALQDALVGERRCWRRL
jgi:hypothetical protein